MKKKLVKSQLCNINTYNLYKREMLTLASNVFEFENLPDYIDLAYLNKTLLKNGSIAFFKDEVLGVIALPYTIIGTLDIYGRPNRIQVYSYTGSYTRSLNKDEYVIMYDNTGCYPIYLDICQMAERIALCKRTIDVNIVQQRTPRIWYTSQDKVESVKELLNEVDGLVENVIGYESLDVEGLDKVCSLSEGAVISFMDSRTVYDKLLYDTAVKTAHKNNIPWQTKTRIAGGNDAGAIQVAGSGCKVIAVSLPSRYLHSAGCVGHIDDMESIEKLVPKLIEAFAELDL